MKVLCVLLVLVAVLGISHSSDLPSRQTSWRLDGRTPFYQRVRLAKTPFIVGGDATTISAHPHHLGLIDLSWGGYICGASNINRLFSLSAAHCLEFGVNPNLINLWGGSTSRIHNGHIFFVTRYDLHPSYNWRTLDFDIAVLQVDPSTPMEGHQWVTPIALPPNCATDCCGVCPPGNNIVVAGWGADDTGRLPENLLQVDKPIVSLAACRSAWGNSITNRFFCTGVENGRDSCGGDSGGAIVRDGIQVGLVSFGTAVCGDGTAPAVYVRIEEPAIRNWIRNLSGV